MPSSPLPSFTGLGPLDGLGPWLPRPPVGLGGGRTGELRCEDRELRFSVSLTANGPITCRFDPDCDAPMIPKSF